MGAEKISKEQARQDALRVLDEYENVLVFGFKKNGESALVGVTEDEIYDKLGLAIAKMLERLGRVDCFTEDLFTGEKLVIVESLGEVKILRPRSIYKAKKSKNQKQ